MLTLSLLPTRKCYACHLAKSVGEFRPHYAAKMEAQGFRCIYCPAALRTVAYEVDHIIPLSRGGSDSADNIQCLCRRCNRRKHDRTHAEFAEIVAAM